jgi:UPF0716 protein FxsA
MTTRTGTAGLHPLWLALAGLILLPAAEFAAFFWVAARIGVLPALIALIATSFVGVSLMRRQGGQAFARLIAAFRRGEPPEGAAREGFMVALGGVLMILPGFVSDAIGFALILPSLLRSWREGSSITIRRAEPRPRADPHGRVIDLDRGEWRAVEDRARRER